MSENTGGMPDSPFVSVEGGDPEASVEEGGGPMVRLFDGGAPGPSVQELQGDYGVSKHWAIFTRGAVRVATGSGIPPLVELVMGGVMAAVTMARDSEGANSDYGNPQIGTDDRTKGDAGDLEGRE